MQRAPDSYAKAASSWSQTAKKKEELRQQGGAGRSVAAIVANLCTNKINSQFPPRDKLVKFLKSAPHYLLEDVEEVCDQLIAKLEDRAWQVHAKSLGVLEALLKDASCQRYHQYLVACPPVFEILQGYERSSKPSVRTKAAGVLELMRNVPRPVQHQQENANESSGLAHGWTEQIDPQSGKVFFFHEASGQTQWDKPEAVPPAPVPKPAPAAQEPAPQLEPSLAAVPAPVDQLQDGWTEEFDKATGKPFFFHAVSGKTQWDKPVVEPVPVPVPAPEPAPSSASAPEPASAAVPAPVDQLQDGWTEEFDKATGKPFFFHAVSGKTQWDKPVVEPVPVPVPAPEPAPMIDLLTEPVPASTPSTDKSEKNETLGTHEQQQGAEFDSAAPLAPTVKMTTNATAAAANRTVDEAAAEAAVAVATQTVEALQEDMVVTQQKLMADQQRITSLMSAPVGATVTAAQQAQKTQEMLSLQQQVMKSQEKLQSLMTQQLEAQQSLLKAKSTLMISESSVGSMETVSSNMDVSNSGERKWKWDGCVAAKGQVVTYVDSQDNEYNATVLQVDYDGLSPIPFYTITMTDPGKGVVEKQTEAKRIRIPPTDADEDENSNSTTNMEYAAAPAMISPAMRAPPAQSEAVPAKPSSGFSFIGGCGNDDEGLGNAEPTDPFSAFDGLSSTTDAPLPTLAPTSTENDNSETNSIANNCQDGCAGRSGETYNEETVSQADKAVTVLDGGIGAIPRAVTNAAGAPLSSSTASTDGQVQQANILDQLYAEAGLQRDYDEGAIIDMPEKLADFARFSEGLGAMQDRVKEIDTCLSTPGMQYRSEEGETDPRIELKELSQALEELRAMLKAEDNIIDSARPSDKQVLVAKRQEIESQQNVLTSEIAGVVMKATASFTSDEAAEKSPASGFSFLNASEPQPQIGDGSLFNGLSLDR